MSTRLHTRWPWYVICVLTCVVGIAVGSAASAAPAGPTGLARGPQSADGFDLNAVDPPPSLTAQAWAVFDAVDDTWVDSRRLTEPRPIASLTKLMTALVVVSRSTGDEQITVPASAMLDDPTAANAGLKPGERYSVDALLDVMLVESANDAANALAAYIESKTSTPFVDLMNQQAADLQLSDSRFTTPSGLDADVLTTSSPQDLITIMQAALNDERIRSAMRMQRYTLKRPDGSSETFTNRNPLLGVYPGVDAGKTGFTDAAGYMLLVHYRDEQGRDLFAMTGHSSSIADRRRDMTALLDWAIPLRQNLTLIESGTALTTLPIPHSHRTVRVFACDDVTASVRVGSRLTERLVVPRAVKPPIAAGDEIGRYEVLVGGKVIGSTAGCSRDTVRADSFTDRVRLYSGEYRTAWKAGLSVLKLDSVVPS